MPKFFQIVDKIKPVYDWTYKIVLFICKILLIVDILITAMAVAGRYIPFIPDPAWSEQIVLTCMVYLAVLSATLAIRDNAHIRMTALDKWIPKNMIKVLDILADLALRPTFDENELNKERGVVLEEISMVEDTPDDLVHELLADAQFSGSLRCPILGPASLIRRYSREDMVRYWSRHYVPQNMVLAIAGNYDWDAFLDLVNTYFDQFPNQKGEEVPFEPQHFVSGRKAKNKDTEQLHICLGFPGIESNCDEIYPLSIFNNALGGGMSSRLFQRIREELGMAYSVYSYASSYRGVGSFNIYAGTNPENGETVIRELQEQMQLFLKDGMTDKEFRSAKAQLRGGFLLGLESSSGRMQSLGRGMLLFGKTRTPEEVIAKIDAVTMEDTMALARKLLCSEPSAAIVGKNAQKYLKGIGGICHG